MGEFDRARFMGGYTGHDFEGATDVGGDDGQPPPSNTLKNIQGKAYADYVAKFMKWPPPRQRKLMGARRRCKLSRHSLVFRSVSSTRLWANDGLVGLGNPPINLPKSRKESRHKDAQGIEAGGKRRSATTNGDVAEKNTR